MIYVINNYVEDGAYMLFETNTESLILRRESTIAKLIDKYSIELANADIIDGKIIEHKWPHSIRTISGQRYSGGEYVLLGKISEKEFKIVSTDEAVQYIDDGQLKAKILDESIANCDYIKEGNKYSYRCTETMNLSTDRKYINSINQQYKEFIAKTKLLGLDMSFRYIIEKDNVCITKYTGKSTKVIIPSFVTSIGAHSFYLKGIKEIKFNSGLKYIGAGAFEENSLERVSLPDTTELICQEAFYSNKVVDSRNQQYYRDSFEIGNKKAIILDTYAQKTLGIGVI